MERKDKTLVRLTLADLITAAAAPDCGTGKKARRMLTGVVEDEDSYELVILRATDNDARMYVEEDDLIEIGWTSRGKS